MNAIGIIFANIHDNYMPELTRKRTLASVPFGGRYRLIDFTLSSMVNSNINKIGVITRHNYQSLMDHLGGGKDWDLARKTGGLFILPPFGIVESSSSYDSRLEALQGILSFITRSDEEFVVLSDGDCVYNIDFHEMLNEHLQKENDITVAYKTMKVDKEMSSVMSAYEMDDNGRVTDLLVPVGKSGKADVCVNIYLLKRTLLHDLVMNSISRGQKSFHQDLIGRNTKKLKIGGYEYKDLFFAMDNIKRFFDCNMQLLNKSVRDELFNQPYRAIHTKIKDSAPTKFFSAAKVSNSMIADGCEIDGEVINSIIFRNVKISRGCVIKNSILMQNTYIGENVALNYVLTDKNVVIKDGHNLSGCLEQPYILTKGTII